MFDGLVIGAGASGLSTALQLARTQMKVSVISSGPPRNNRSSSIRGLLGQDGISPAGFLEAGRNDLGRYGISVSDGRAIRLTRRDNGFECMLDSGFSLPARRIVIATGVEDILPEIPGLSERWGYSVLPCAYCHAFELTGNRFGVLASDPASVFSAGFLTSWGEVTLFSSGLLDQWEEEFLSRRDVHVVHGDVSAIIGDRNKSIHAIKMKDGSEYAADSVFLTPHTRPNLIPSDFSIKVEDVAGRTIISTNERKETCTPGVYAVGDISRTGHTVTWAISDGVTAAIALHQSIILEG